MQLTITEPTSHMSKSMYNPEYNSPASASELQALFALGQASLIRYGDCNIDEVAIYGFEFDVDYDSDTIAAEDIDRVVVADKPLDFSADLDSPKHRIAKASMRRLDAVCPTRATYGSGFRDLEGDAYLADVSLWVRRRDKPPITYRITSDNQGVCLDEEHVDEDHRYVPYLMTQSEAFALTCIMQDWAEQQAKRLSLGRRLGFLLRGL